MSAHQDTQQHIYGFHAVKKLLQNKKAVVEKIFLVQGRLDARSQELSELARQRNVPCELLSRVELDKLTNFSKHQGFVALCIMSHLDNRASQNSHDQGKNDELELKAFVKKVQLTNSAFFLVLDGVQDPHNLGACLRAANAAGVQAVIIPKDNAVGLTSAVYKVACGAVEDTPVFQVPNLVRTLNYMKECGVWIYGTDITAEKNIYEVKLQQPLAIVMGAEEKGLRRLTREQCDYLFSIPMLGTVQSLNVAVATGVCLFEVVRNQIVTR